MVVVDTNQRLQLQVKASSCSLANAKHNKPTKNFSAPPGAGECSLHQPHFFCCAFAAQVKFERGICRSRLRACMVVCADSERALASATDLCVWWRICHSSSSWSCGHSCSFVVVPRASHAPRNAVWPRLCDPSVHGTLGVMDVCKPSWANL